MRTTEVVGFDEHDNATSLIVHTLHCDAVQLQCGGCIIVWYD